jgi:hypothetical protein
LSLSHGISNQSLLPCVPNIHSLITSLSYNLLPNHSCNCVLSCSLLTRGWTLVPKILTTCQWETI